jgi:hypothetical protein
MYLAGGLAFNQNVVISKSRRSLTRCSEGKITTTSCYTLYTPTNIMELTLYNIGTFCTYIAEGRRRGVENPTNNENESYPNSNPSLLRFKSAVFKLMLAYTVADDVLDRK